MNIITYWSEVNQVFNPSPVTCYPMQIAEILEKTGQTETMVLREHAILTILTKLSRYESECALFEKKYGVTLEFFNT